MGEEMSSPLQGIFVYLLNSSCRKCSFKCSQHFIASWGPRFDFLIWRKVHLRLSTLPSRNHSTLGQDRTCSHTHTVLLYWAIETGSVMLYKGVLLSLMPGRVCYSLSHALFLLLIEFFARKYWSKIITPRASQSASSLQIHIFDFELFSRCFSSSATSVTLVTNIISRA